MNIIIENKELCLTVSPECIPLSLICKATGEECLESGENIALFSVTEDRPFNNEIKLAHPNKRTTFQANSLRREGNRLIVGFELVAFEAVVEIREAEKYVSFELADFLKKPQESQELSMDFPPVAEFRIIQLPIKNREKFGEWLNVMWDEKAAVNVLGNSPFAIIDSEKRDGYRILSADAIRDIRLKGCSASLIVTPGAALPDAIEQLEEDLDLPRGVASRRNEWINASVYWTPSLNMDNVDEHIAYAKAGGFSMMLVYYTAMFVDHGDYSACGDYDWNTYYPNGRSDLEAVLKKIKEAGIVPGLHFLQTHIGIRSRYVTPVADHRLHLKRHFTLAKELGKEDTILYVEQNPAGSVVHEKCRVLQFGGELIHYEGYRTERPYHFWGCQRGFWETKVAEHPLGTIGGILDVSEFGATSVYIDQETDLQDEVAEKLANAYNSGFEFVYFDGSEGTNAPFEIYIPDAQYKVYQKLEKAPLFCEGAAKSHFSWHMLSGGNAFDIFPTPIFKKKIAEFPLEEAGRMAEDFTRVNFGWWGYWNTTMPDHMEYGTSKAASWDCPVTIQSNLEMFESNKRTPDNLEVMKRWEDIRRKKWLTKEQKEALRNPDQEFILLVNEEGEYELEAYESVKLPGTVSEDINAYQFKRGDRAYVVFWHLKDHGKLQFCYKKNELNREALDGLICEEQLGGNRVPIEITETAITISAAGRRYLSGVSENIWTKLFETAELLKE